MSLFLLFLSAFLINNIIFMRFIGLCPYFGLSSKLDTSIGMGFSVIFVVVLSSVITWFLYKFVLLPLNLVFLRTTVFILVIATVVQFIELYFKKYIPVLYSAFGIYLPLITTNCVVLAVAFLNVDYNHNLLQTIVYSLGVSGGFALAIVMMAGIRMRIETAPIPEPMKGLPIAFITASLIALAFLGFKGLLGL
uniref:Ion-translocating oxidoreductase complex subunit A n=1 Tax=candidate division WOR-3 bacterium TaxID=2052148 RepID=A0A7C4YC38_UNCW3